MLGSSVFLRETLNDTASRPLPATFTICNKVYMATLNKYRSFRCSTLYEMYSLY